MSFQDQDQPEKRLCIGKITGAHGVKGLVKILPFCEDLALLEQVSEHKIHLKNPQGKYILANIEGVSDRDAAEALKGTELHIPRDLLPTIEDENSFYIEDLIGLKALNEKAEHVGNIVSVENYGAGDLLEIRLTSGQAILIPFHDEYVPNIAESVTIRNYEAFLP